MVIELFPSFSDPSLKIKILDYTYTSEPSINTALPLKQSTFKSVLFIIGSILSLGFVWLLGKWDDRKKAIMKYQVCQLSECTHILVEEEEIQSGKTIVQMTRKYQPKVKRDCPAFTYHNRNYIHIQEKEVFVPIRYEELGLHLDKLKKDQYVPLTSNKRAKLLDYYGPNVMRLPVESKTQIFIQQMLTPFQIFQTYGIILWICEQYFLFVFILVAYSLYEYWYKSKEVSDNQQKLAYESYFDVSCNVLINDNDNDNDQSAEGECHHTQKIEAELCKNPIKQDQHKSDIMKDDFNGVDQVQIDIQMIQVGGKGKGRDNENTIVRRPSKQYHNFESSLLNNKDLKFISVSSHHLVPGDLILLHEGDLVPCDCLLLRGEALVNQKYTTGENYLVRKEEIEDFVYQKQNQKGYLLYLGTEIVKIKSNKKNEDSADQIVCLVTQTNFNTLRGKFLRAILYQPKQKKSFTLQTISFLYILLILTTVVYICLFPLLYYLLPSFKMFQFYLDLIFTAIPPTLPTILSVGISFVLRRLHSAGIHCVTPGNVLTGGRAQVVVMGGSDVFGKEYKVDSVQVGVRGVRGFGLTFGSVKEIMEYRNEDVSFREGQNITMKRQQKKSLEDINKMFINAISSCHTLQFFHSSIEGSVHQKRIFQFSSSIATSSTTFQTPTSIIETQKIIRFKEKDHKLAVISNVKHKQYEQIQSSSDVSVKIQENIPLVKKELSLLDGEREMGEQLNQLNQLNQTVKPVKKYTQTRKVEERKEYAKKERKVIFLKGSPEKILSACIPSTFPQNSYEYILDMAEKGFTLYCYAMKEIDLGSGSTAQIIQEMAHECGKYTFLGFVILQQVKSEGSVEAIQTLKRSQVKLVLLSQERQLDCTPRAIINGLCDKNELLMCALSRHHNKIYCKGHIEWESSGSEQEMYHQFIRQIDQIARNSKLSISSGLYEQLFIKRQIGAADTIFNKAIVYNKMELKHERHFYNQLDRKEKVSLAVGNGGNVSQHASISLQLQRQSSSLLSSFHTATSSLTCIIDCLRICRAGLSTNFHCFSMIVLFSLVQFTTICLLAICYCTMTNTQTLYEDLFISFPIFITINMTKPSDQLSKELPPGSFFSRKNLISMGGQLVIQFVAQAGFISYLLSKEFYRLMREDAKGIMRQEGDFSNKPQLCLTLFVLSNYLYLGIALATSVSKPFRKPFYTNPFYTSNLILLWIYNTLVVIQPSLVPQEMRPSPLDQQTEFMLVLAMLLGNLVMVVMYLFQNGVVWLFRRGGPMGRKDRMVESVTVEYQLK